MTFYKKKSNGTFKKEDQIKWKNESPEKTFSPLKLWYGIINIGNKSFKVEYESKFRSEVEAIFSEQARLAHGELTYLGVYK
jgi:hypothetical protein